MRIGVIGSGVAGSLFTAAAANLPGVELQTYEKIEAGAREDAGTGLNIGPNAPKAIRAHGGLEPLLQALMDVSLPWRRWRIELTDGTRLIDIDLEAVAGEPGRRLRWADLYQVLRAACAERTRYGLGLQELEEDAQGRLIPVFRDPAGEIVRGEACDLLVAGDGRYSRLRTLVAGLPQPDFPGIGTWRLLVRDAKDSPIDEYTQYFCGNARLLSFRVPGEEVYIAGSFPLRGEGPVPEAARTAAAQRAHFLPKGDRPPSREVEWMLDQIDSRQGQMNWARTQQIQPLHQAMDGQVLMLGDAAHAMFQTLGQGATQSIEDALAAAAVLKDGHGSARAITAAYEARRRERVDFARRFSEEATDTMLPGADAVAGSLAKAEAPFIDKLKRLYLDVA